MKVSTNGVNLLQQMMLPRIQINPMNNEIGVLGLSLIHISMCIRDSVCPYSLESYRYGESESEDSQRRLLSCSYKQKKEVTKLLLHPLYTLRG